MPIGRRLAGAFLAAALLGTAAAPAASAQEITLWSHWAAEQPKRQFVEEAIRRFQAANPGVSVRATWYEKNALYAALRTALRAGQGPDVFYAEPDQVEYVQNNLLLDLSSGINWANVEPWARAIWTHGGKPYGLPLEAWTVELYVNTRLLGELGAAMPANLQFSEAAFLDLVRKARARNITPISAGVGDRPFPGAFLTHEALLMRLGLADYGKLLAGDLAWSDPRVVDGLRFMRSLVDARAFPPGVATLQLGQSHIYFHTNPGTVFFPMGSWYTSRAFNPPDQGGQPADFPLGILRMPAPANAACAHCRTIAVGGSYVVNARTREPDVAKRFLNSFATPEMGNLWLTNVLVQTGIKADASRIEGPRAGYFRQLAAANAGSEYFFGIPLQILQGRARETFTQVVNAALISGQVSVEEVVRQMTAAQAGR
ncbi:MAG: extracellular solute-binding protein [Acetobacteraceae bacterium]|nr:extracellular solute-binding protein [Acetobacteraceae bacterium]